MNARLLRGIGANLLGQIITVVIQLASVPVLIHCWGGSKYGVWILLSALPMALSFADGGLVLASGNAMVIAVARGDTAHAAALLRRSLRVVGLAALSLGVMTTVTLMLLPDYTLHGAAGVADHEIRAVLVVLAAVVLVGVVSNVTASGFRANGDYAVGVVCNDTVRLAESIAVVAVALAGGELLAAAIAWLGARLIGQGLSASLLLRRAAWARAPRTDHDPRILHELLRPALASLTIPAAFAVSLQGATIAIGLVLPPSSVAAFGAARTLTRAMVQVSGLINHAVMPEVAIAVGRGDDHTKAALSQVSLVAALATLLPAWTVLAIFGPTLLGIWTSHKLAIDPTALAVMASAALVHGLWLSEANLMLAINRHGEYGWVFLLAASLATVGVFLLARPFGLLGAAAALLAGEVAMASWIMLIRRRTTRRGLGLLQMETR